jgi:beta-lactamase class A
MFAMAALLAGFWKVSLAQANQATTSEADRNATTRQSIEELIQESGAQEVSVAFRPLDNRQGIFINADKAYPATSQWVEIPVMIELHAGVEARHLKLSDTLVVENRFRSALDGSFYQLEPGRDADRELYSQIGQRVSLGDLQTHMLKRNSQLATNLLIQLLGIAQIDGRLGDLGASGVRLRHGFQDEKAEKAGEQNVATAGAMTQILRLLANNAAISAEASKEMVGLIANARTATSGPFAADPTSVESGGNSQQAVIVYGARSFALAVVVRGLKSGGASAALIAKISHALAATN